MCKALKVQKDTNLPEIIGAEKETVIENNDASGILILPETTESRHQVQSIESQMRATQKSCFAAENIEAVIAQVSGAADFGWPLDPKTGMPVSTTAERSKSEMMGTEIYSLQTDSHFDCIVIYLHGGAFLYGINELHIHLCDALAVQTGAKIIIPLYKRIPNHHCAEAIALLEQIYTELQKEDKPVLLVGDSSGGGLALGFVNYCQDKDLPLPAGIILISPWLDMTLSRPEIEVLEKRDMMLSAEGLRTIGKIWAGDWKTTDPYVSPICGCNENMPEILMFTGTEDLMAADAHRLYEELESKTNMTWVIGEGLYHIFAISEMTEQGRQAGQMMIDFIIWKSNCAS